MKSLWNDKEAKEFLDNPVSLRAYTSRLLGQDDTLVLHGGGNTSVKVNQKNIFNEDEDILYVKGSGHDLRTIKENGFAPCRLDYLKKLGQLSSLSDTDMMRELKASQIDPSAPAPSVEAILHALIPFKYVDHTHTDAVVTVTNTPGGEQKLKEIYGDDVLVLPYIMPGFILSKQVYEATLDLDWKKYKAIILLHHGVFTYSEEAKTAYENMIDVVSQAEDYIKKQGAWDKVVKDSTVSLPDAKEVATLRKMVCEKAGRAMLARFKGDELSKGHASLDNVEGFSCRGPITPDHVLHTKRVPAIIESDLEKSVEDFCSDYKKYFEKNGSNDLTMLDPAPRYAIWKGKGIAHFAPNPKRLMVVEDIVAHTSKCVQWGEALGSWEALPEKDIFDLEYWELEQAKLKRGGSIPEFEGRVALVTGAASGIGRSIALDLLKQGAAVVGVDLDEKVKDLASSPAYIGLTGDLTKTEIIQDVLRQAVCHFGGIDVLVSNAGTFPPSKTISEMSDEFWEKTVDVNLSSHMKVLREVAPYLERGISPAVVIVGSKNVPAPGPGVSAYSCSKAALTQLARVSAMELGPKGIRVNTIHPNAVFDTGIWTQEVLEKRAKHYGLSVDDYKRNNILKKEITSHDVAAVTRLLLGEGFATVTGAQVPIDGGNDRVI